MIVEASNKTVIYTLDVQSINISNQHYTPVGGKLMMMQMHQNLHALSKVIDTAEEKLQMRMGCHEPGIK